MITTGDVVLLAGPRGVRRASGGGEFALAAARSRAAVDQFDRAGSAIFAYGSTAIVRTTNAAARGPSAARRGGRRTRPLRLRDVDMTSAKRLRARQRRPRVAHDERRPALDRAARASAPTTGSRSRSARRLGLPDARAATRPTTTWPTCCARATADGSGGRSGSPAARFPGTEGVISPTRRGPTR